MHQFRFKNFLGVQSVERISFGCKIGQYAWQGVLQALFRLDAVVENHNGAWASVLNHVSEHLIRRDIDVEITTQYIPHHNPVMPQQKLGLFGGYPAIWWPKQHGFGLAGTLTDVVKIRDVFGAPTIQVVHGVIAHYMTGIHNLLKHFGVLADVVSYTKEGSLGIVLFQLLQYPRGNFRNGAVIKGEKNLFFLGRYPPGEVGEQVLDKLGCLDQIHKHHFLGVLRQRATTPMFTG